MKSGKKGMEFLNADATFNFACKIPHFPPGEKRSKMANILLTSYVNTPEVWEQESMRIRVSNHKSHVTKIKLTCRVAIHFNDRTVHKIDYENNIDTTLPKELIVTLIDKVVPDPWDSTESITKKLGKKEGYWQSQLRTLESDGGLNIRNERLFAKRKYA